MNSQEAKFILQSYRHGGGDANDPQFQEALDLAGRDPELARWLVEQTAFDAAISKKIQSTSVPADLKANILAGRKIIQPKPWWTRRSWIAAAACFLLLCSITTVLMRSSKGDNFAQYRRDMTTFLSTKLDHLDMDTADLTKIRTFLAAKGAKGDFVLPEKIEELRKLGCRVIDWHGEKVTLVCFKLNGPNEVHLLVANQSKFRNAPATRSPQFAKSGDWMTASWSHDGKVYVLAGMGDRSALEKFL